MIESFIRSVYIFVILLITAVLISCGGGGGTSTGTGTLDIVLTDAPGNYDYKNIFVTIAEVQVNKSLDDQSSSWVTVATPNQTFDLLKLQNGVTEPLGSTILEAGRYNQMRLLLTDEKPTSHPYANYLVIEGEDPIELRVLPSELKNGIKIVQGFTIEVGGSTELILDFDADKSVVQSQGVKGWHLKPTIRVLETVTYSVRGIVKDEVSSPLNGVAISAQIYDFLADNTKKEIEVVAGTESDSVNVNDNIIDGYYFMYLPINQDFFNIVATISGYLPQCRELDATETGISPYKDYDFNLIPETKIGTLNGSIVDLPMPEVDEIFYVSLSIRQIVDCNDDDVPETKVELKLLNFVNEDGTEITYGPISLPVGDYEIVAWADDTGDKVLILDPISITIDENIVTSQNVDFQP